MTQAPGMCAPRSTPSYTSHAPRTKMPQSHSLLCWGHCGEYKGILFDPKSFAPLCTLCLCAATMCVVTAAAIAPQHDHGCALRQSVLSLLNGRHSFPPLARVRQQAVKPVASYPPRSTSPPNPSSTHGHSISIRMQHLVSNDVCPCCTRGRQRRQ